MNRTSTKALRKKVMEEMGYEPNAIETPHEIAKYPEFKKILRARKKNENRARNRQSPKLTATDIEPNYKLWKRWNKKGKKNRYRNNPTRRK
jgi:hypothetical protein